MRQDRGGGGASVMIGEYNCHNANTAHSDVHTRHPSLPHSRSSQSRGCAPKDHHSINRGVGGDIYYIINRSSSTVLIHVFEVERARWGEWARIRRHLVALHGHWAAVQRPLGWAMRQHGLFRSDFAAWLGPFNFRWSVLNWRAGITAGGGEGHGRGRGRGRGTVFYCGCFGDGIQFEIQRCARCEPANNNDKIYNMGIESTYIWYRRLVVLTRATTRLGKCFDNFAQQRLARGHQLVFEVWWFFDRCALTVDHWMTRVIDKFVKISACDLHLVSKRLRNSSPLRNTGGSGK